MKIAYFDCIAGASGDMILGALLDAGLDEGLLRQQLAALKLSGFSLTSRQVFKGGLRATQVEIDLHDPLTERSLPELERILTDSDLPEEIACQALKILRRLAEVEASIHGEPVEQVHLHELGGLDTLVDVIGALLALDYMKIEQVYASSLPIGGGFVKSAHGLLPLPAPATLALLDGVPLRGVELQAELVTPTGAAILASLVRAWGAIPPMKLSAVGYGAGSRDLPIPNVLRLLIGESASPATGVTESLALVETNIDDQNPQFYDYLMERLFQAGALDVSLIPIQMKKNRPGILLRLLCHPPQAPALEAILYSETSTLGVRVQTVERHSLSRAIHTVETPYGPVRVKVADIGAGEYKFAPEYEDCRKLAEQHNLPLREVYLAAEVAAKSSLRDLDSL
jgi:hypothetical protein